MKILELFSGYGTASFALKRIGMSYELVGYSDIDKYANRCFKQNHCPDDKDDKLRLGDVTKINPYELKNFDLLTGGFPCQTFSNAGKMKGELDPRGTLFNEIIRIAEVKQPKYMLLENVKGLTFKKFKDTFDMVLSELDRIGYTVYWKVLNSKDFGVPQNRERVWFVCFRKDVEHSFEFPEPRKLELFIKDILEDSVDEKYNLTEKMQERLTEYMNEKNNHPFILRGRPKMPYEKGKRTLKYTEYTDVCPTISQNCASGDQKNIVMNTITQAVGRSGHSREELEYINRVGQLRRLTPKECFRLMGFLNDEINIEGLSDTQRYKLAGNGQDVNVVSLLFNKMFEGE